MTGIEVKKNVQNGEPVLSGTRVTVREVLEAVKIGKDVSTITSDLREAGLSVTEKHVEKAIDYASEAIRTSPAGA